MTTAFISLSTLNGTFQATGLHGDGTTDDAAAIQALVNAMPANGKLCFDGGKTYAISQPIDCRGKSIHIDGGNSTFKTIGAYPNNLIFIFGATLASSAA